MAGNRGKRASREAKGFPIRRATATEAAHAREFVQEAFTDRIAWVAARTLLERVQRQATHRGGEDATIPGSLLSDIDTFLRRHPVGQ
jgi:hypothetical protein